MRHFRVKLPPMWLVQTVVGGGGVIIVAIFKNTIITTKRLASVADVRVLVENSLRLWPISLTWCSCPGPGHSQCYTWISPSVTSPWWGSEPGRCPELPLRARLKRPGQTQKCTYLLLNVSPFTHLVTMVNSIQLFGSISWFPGTAPSRWVTSIWTNGIKMRFWPTNGVPLGSLRFKRGSAKQEHYSGQEINTVHCDLYAGYRVASDLYKKR